MDELNNLPNNSGNAQAASQNPQSQALNSQAQAANETPNTNIAIEELQRQIKELRAENAKHRNKAKEQELAAQQEQDRQLQEQGKYKDLAEKHERRVKELEPISESYKQLAELVAGQIEAQIKDWPAEIKVFDPGQDATVEQRLAWLEKSKPLIEKLQLQARSNQPGNGPNPKPSQQTPEGLRTTFEQKLRASGKYGA